MATEENGHDIFEAPRAGAHGAHPDPEWRASVRTARQDRPGPRELFHGSGHLRGLVVVRRADHRGDPGQPVAVFHGTAPPSRDRALGADRGRPDAGRSGRVLHLDIPRQPGDRELDRAAGKLGSASSQLGIRPCGQCSSCRMRVAGNGPGDRETPCEMTDMGFRSGVGR